MSRKVFLARASFIVALGAVFSKVLGFVREMVIAARFGATSHVDAYVIAQGLPGLLFAAIGASLGTVVIPLFTARRIKEGDDAAFQMASTIWNAVALSALIVMVAGELIMPWLVRLVAPGFRGAVFEETVLLGRILMPAVFFTGVGLLARGMLNALQHFTAPAFTDPAQNIIVIISILTLGQLFGIRGLAIGTLIGMGAQLFLLWPVLARCGFHPGMKLDPRLPELRQILRLMVPVLIGTGIGTINALVDRMLASGLSAGSVAAMNYATRIYTLPLVFLGNALSTVLYPTMSEFVAHEEWENISESVHRGLRIAAFGLLPMTAGLVILAEPIVRIVYERGAFRTDATALTAGIMAMYSLGIVAITWRDVVGRAFYAACDVVTPLVTGALAVAINVILNLALVRFMGARGLALATAVSSWIGALSLMWAFERKVGLRVFGGPEFLLEVGKCLVATLLMGIVVFLFWEAAAGNRPLTTLTLLAFFLADVAVGFVTYVAFAFVLKMRDLGLFIEMGGRTLASIGRLGSRLLVALRRA